VTDRLPAELEEVLSDLGRRVEALGPYTETAVLTGGLAALLYRWCLPGSGAGRPALMTFDMDWALPPRIETHGMSLRERMEVGGFRPWLQGPGKAPVTYYQHERHGIDRLARIYAEFIAPRTGSKTDRAGRNTEILEVEPGLHAQTDPYLGLLLVENLVLDVSAVAATGLTTPHFIRFPHPICYVVQKILIRPKRQPYKQANDAAHVYDVALLSRGMWPQMKEVFARIEKGRLFPAKWFERARRTIGDAFLRPEAPGPREIANVYRGITGSTAAPTEAAISRVLVQFSESTGLRIP